MGLRFRPPFPTFTIHLATRAAPGSKNSATVISKKKKKIQQRKDKKDEEVNKLNEKSPQSTSTGVKEFC